MRARRHRCGTVAPSHANLTINAARTNLVVTGVTVAPTSLLLRVFTKWRS